MGLYGGGSAPSADPEIGKAAMASAKLGKQYLGWMKDQAKISNQWADEDRSRYKSVFEPLQDDFIEEAQNYDSPERQQEASREAVADVRQNAALAQEASRRTLTRMGVDPRSGRFKANERRTAMDTGLASAGAANSARKQIEAEGRGLRAQAVNLGSGFAVNPATSLGMAGGAMSSGFKGAMQGQGQKGSLLNTQFQQQMQGWQANQQSSSSMMSGLGSLAGMAMFMSSKDYKENKRPARGVLDALKEMPVEQWKYKDGIADGGEHIGPYAEDFQAATGKGDGKSIPVIDAVGMTMGAVKELAEKVDTISENMGRGVKRKPKGGASSKSRGIMGAMA